jgi:HK97 family phage portal protein
MPFTFRMPFWNRKPSVTAARALDADIDRRLLSVISGAAEDRAVTTSNADYVDLSTAVFAAIRRRARALARIRIALVRDNGSNVEELPDSHPALSPLQRLNGSTSRSHGLSLLETHLLTAGRAFWVKRRNRLGVPVEFEVWPPERVAVLRDPERPWMPARFRHYRPDGLVEEVDPQDVVYFRFLIDPRDPLMGIGPITAARLAVNTGIEAARFNWTFFKNNAQPSVIYTVDGGPGEAERVEAMLEAKFRGTDRAHRALVTPGGLKVVSSPLSHHDMEFIESQRWTLEEVARAFEVSPVLLGDMSQATKENLEAFLTDFFEMVADEATLILEQLTEQYIRPDFGAEFRLVADLSGIPYLQGNRKEAAEVDRIQLESGLRTINELRQRDNLSPVPWGDVPILESNKVPLVQGETPGTATPAEGTASLTEGTASLTPRARAAKRSLKKQETTLRERMESILVYELRRLLRAIDAHVKQEGRAQEPPIDDSVLSDYDWDWMRHAEPLEGDLTSVYAVALEAAGFVPTPLLPAQELAVRYARQRAADLLRLDGPKNIVELTRERVRQAIADTIAAGGGVRDLKNRLRQDYAFSPKRAELIARTELAFAQSDATVKSFQSQGHEGLQWHWPAGADEDGVCDLNDGEIRRLGEAFPSGHFAPPAHPGCRCSALPVREVVQE